MVYRYLDVTYTWTHWFLFVQFYECIMPEGANMLSAKYIPVFVTRKPNVESPYIIASSYPIKYFTDSI